MVHEIVVRFEHSVRQPVLAQELPEFSTGLSSGHFGGSAIMVMLVAPRDRRQVPAGLIDQEYGVCAGRDSGCDLHKVKVHRLGVAGRQDQGCSLTLFRADGTEDVGGSGALVAGRTWACAVLRPAAGDLVLLADTSLVCEPDLYRVDADRLSRAIASRRAGKLF